MNVQQNNAIFESNLKLAAAGLPTYSELIASLVNLYAHGKTEAITYDVEDLLAKAGLL